MTVKKIPGRSYPKVVPQGSSEVLEKISNRFGVYSDKYSAELEKGLISSVIGWATTGLHLMLIFKDVITPQFTLWLSTAWFLSATAYSAYYAYQNYKITADMSLSVVELAGSSDQSKAKLVIASKEGGESDFDMRPTLQKYKGGVKELNPNFGDWNLVKGKEWFYLAGKRTESLNKFAMGYVCSFFLYSTACGYLGAFHLLPKATTDIMFLSYDIAMVATAVIWGCSWLYSRYQDELVMKELVKAQINNGKIPISAEKDLEPIIKGIDKIKSWIPISFCTTHDPEMALG